MIYDEEGTGEASDKFYLFRSLLVYRCFGVFTVSSFSIDRFIHKTCRYLVTVVIHCACLAWKVVKIDTVVISCTWAFQMKNNLDHLMNTLYKTSTGKEFYVEAYLELAWYTQINSMIETFPQFIQWLIDWKYHMSKLLKIFSSICVSLVTRGCCHLVK